MARPGDSEEQVGLAGECDEEAGQDFRALCVVGGIEQDPSSSRQVDPLQPARPTGGAGSVGDSLRGQFQLFGGEDGEPQVPDLVGAGEVDPEIVLPLRRPELDALPAPALRNDFNDGRQILAEA
jgi:hypothetical protein